jgi:hypothetical protein
MLLGCGETSNVYRNLVGEFSWETFTGKTEGHRTRGLRWVFEKWDRVFEKWDRVFEKWNRVFEKWDRRGGQNWLRIVSVAGFGTFGFCNHGLCYE